MNNIETINHKETSVLSIIAHNPEVSQRILSLSLSVSLGQINSIIKSLIDKQEIEIKRTDGRTLEYHVTDKGKSRCMRYMKTKLADAFKQVTNTKRAVGIVLERLFEQGIREFVLDGENDTLAAIVSEVFRESIGEAGKLLWGPVNDSKYQIILKLDGVNHKHNENVVNLMQEVTIL